MFIRFKRFLKQVAVYWPPNPADSEGRITYQDPVEIPCRWTDTQEEFIDMEGNRKISRSKVLANTDMAPQGVLWLSTAKVSDPAGTAIAQLTSQDDPFANPLAYAVQKYGKIPTRTAKQFLRIAWM